MSTRTRRISSIVPRGMVCFLVDERGSLFAANSSDCTEKRTASLSNGHSLVLHRLGTLFVTKRWSERIGKFCVPAQPILLSN